MGARAGSRSPGRRDRNGRRLSGNARAPGSRWIPVRYPAESDCPEGANPMDRLDPPGPWAGIWRRGGADAPRSAASSIRPGSINGRPPSGDFPAASRRGSAGRRKDERDPATARHDAGAAAAGPDHQGADDRNRHRLRRRRARGTAPTRSALRPGLSSSARMPGSVFEGVPAEQRLIEKELLRADDVYTTWADLLALPLALLRLSLSVVVS